MTIQQSNSFGRQTPKTIVSNKIPNDISYL